MELSTSCGCIAVRFLTFKRRVGELSRLDR
jgi:hypothetical protein